MVLIISYWTTHWENEDYGIPHLGQVERDLQRAKAIFQTQLVSLQYQQIRDGHKAGDGQKDRQYGRPTYWDKNKEKESKNEINENTTHW